MLQRSSMLNEIICTTLFLLYGHPSPKMLCLRGDWINFQRASGIVEVLVKYGNIAFYGIVLEGGNFQKFFAELFDKFFYGFSPIDSYMDVFSYKPRIDPD